MQNRGACGLKMCFDTERSNGDFYAHKSKTIASLMKMRSTLEVSKGITKGVLAIICSNSFSHCKVAQKKTAMFLMYNHVHKYYITVTKTGV